MFLFPVIYLLILGSDFADRTSMTTWQLDPRFEQHLALSHL